MFVNDESFRQISQNCDYFCIFKNPRNSSEIRALAQQIPPGNMILVQIYMDATKTPFSYLFINLTQECDANVKFISDIFNDLCVYIPDGRTFKKIRTVGEYDNIKLINSGFNMIDKTSNGIIFNNMGNNNNTGQTTKVNTHLVNFGQHYQFEPSNIPMNKLKMDNLSKQSMKNNEASTNTNLTNNTFTQTQPIEYYEAGVNTNLANNRFTQTHEGKVDMQSVNIPNQNQISTHNYTCKCEDDDVEMDQTGIQYRSDFARQLQKSEVIPNAQPVTNYNSERPRQTESSTLYHIPQQSISHTQPHALQYTQQRTIHQLPNQESIQPSKITQQALQPPALQYRQTHGIENMETDAIDYQAQQLSHVPEGILVGDN